MSLSPLKSPSSYSRGSHRRGGSSSPAGWIIAVLVGGLALFLAWRFGFGLPAKVSRAVSLARGGEPAVALERLGALAGDHPDDARLLDALGLCQVRLGHAADGVDDYAKARRAGLANGADLHIDEGKAALARGDWQGAAAEFDHAAMLDPRSAKALAGQAGVAMVNGKLNDALDLYKQALAANPGLKEAQDGQLKAREAVDRGSLYYLYDRNGEPLARRAVTAAGLGERSYPQAQLCAHVVGYLSKKAGDAGLERDLGALFGGTEVQLTLDVRLQQAASHALGWHKGAIVALDPRTGEVLAALSQPGLQPGSVDKDYYKLRDNPNKPLTNRAFDGLYEPGSIAKIMTAAGALEGNVDMSKIFPMVPQTAINLDGKIFRDWEDHGKLRSLKEAMDVSSNIALYQVGKAMGPDQLFRIINRFGFNHDIDLGFTLGNGAHYDIKVASPRAPMIPDTQFALAERSCGLGEDYRISPLQAARMAAVIANGGALMKTQLVRQVRSLSGETLYDLKPQVEAQVIKPETANKVRELMEDAVEGDRGIGKKARVEGIKVAGKTGTARTHKKGQLDAWFICFAPADKPKLAVAVFCDQEGTGMHVAAPIAGAFLDEALR
jgi:peptidoglycan glycosyltransferase